MQNSGYILLRTTRRWKKILDYIAMLPASIPALIFGVGLLIAYLRPPLKLYGTMWILLIAYLTTLIPYGVRTTSSSLIQVSKELEEAGRVSGARWMTTFRRITLPLIKPGILAGWILVFVTLMRELGSSILLYTPRTVVSSIVLWNLWDEGKFVAMSAFAVLITLISVVFVTLLFKFVRTSISVG